MARYSSTTAMGGKIYAEGLPERGLWNSGALVYYPEETARIMAAPYPRDRLASDAGDLRRIVKGSTLPAVNVYIREDPETVAQQLWEEEQSELRKSPRWG